MNTAIISDRYANAFYGYAKKQGSLKEVYEQARLIFDEMGRDPAFFFALSGKLDVSLDEKMGLIDALVSPKQARPEFRSLLNLLKENDRVEMLLYILFDFLYYYRDKNNIATLLVTTAVPGGTIPEIFANYAANLLGSEIELLTRVNPEIMGGFICESWELCYDASVKYALTRAQKKLSDSIIDYK